MFRVASRAPILDLAVLEAMAEEASEEGDRDPFHPARLPDKPRRPVKSLSEGVAVNIIIVLHIDDLLA